MPVFDIYIYIDILETRMIKKGTVYNHLLSFGKISFFISYQIY